MKKVKITKKYGNGDIEETFITIKNKSNKKSNKLKSEDEYESSDNPKDEQESIK